MVRAVRDAIVMSPPLIITPDQIDFIIDVLRQALDEAQHLLTEA